MEFYTQNGLVRPARTSEKSSSAEALRLPRREENDPGADAKRRFIPPHTAAEMIAPTPLEEYAPTDSLIHKVRLFPWKSTYHYYDEFVRDAERLWLLRGEKCTRVPFFSYVPQYSQLSRAQLAWYLYWRDCFRHGESLETDYSYLLLFIYELINLSGKVDAVQAQRFLVRLWKEYRATYAQLDAYLAEWICDYSLIHHLPSPEDTDGETLGAVMNHCTLREFYVRGDGERGYVSALLAFASNHFYRKSKFYTAETKAAFERWIPATLAEVVRRMSEDGKLFSCVGMEDSRMLRDAYTGALCSYRFKRKIEVEYASFSRSHELRFLVTDIVKYTENLLRAHFGIRSRLSVAALPIPVRECIDAFLKNELPSHRAMRQKEAPIPQYEAQYEPLANGLSISRAAEIEAASWGTTEQLVGAFSDEEKEERKEEVLPPPTTPSAETMEDTVCNGDGAASLREFADALSAARKSGTAFAEAAKAADAFGDILLEETEDGFGVLEEYRPLVDEWLREWECSRREER